MLRPIGPAEPDPDVTPSNHKNLWQHFLGPYQLALQCYVVVATDYAGLGVAKDPSGEPIMHEHLDSASQAERHDPFDQNSLRSFCKYSQASSMKKTSSLV